LQCCVVEGLSISLVSEPQPAARAAAISPLRDPARRPDTIGLAPVRVIGLATPKTGNHWNDASLCNDSNPSTL
jgi:hypothetical protein